MTVGSKIIERLRELFFKPHTLLWSGRKMKAWCCRIPFHSLSGHYSPIQLLSQQWLLKYIQKYRETGRQILSAGITISGINTPRWRWKQIHNINPFVRCFHNAQWGLELLKHREKNMENKQHKAKRCIKSRPIFPILSLYFYGFIGFGCENVPRRLEFSGLFFL